MNDGYKWEINNSTEYYHQTYKFIYVEKKAGSNIPFSLLLVYNLHLYCEMKQHSHILSMHIIQIMLNVYLFKQNEPGWTHDTCQNLPSNNYWFATDTFFVTGESDW